MTNDATSGDGPTKKPVSGDPLQPENVDQGIDPHAPTSDPTIIPTKPCTDEDSTCVVPRPPATRPGTD